MTAVYTQGSQIDHYEIIRQLGHGGMSRVYLACDMQDQQKVVLKFPNDELIGDIAVYERYKREAEIGNRVKHPHVQHLVNPGEHHSDEYLVWNIFTGVHCASFWKRGIISHFQSPKPCVLPCSSVMLWSIATSKVFFIAISNQKM